MNYPTWMPTVMLTILVVVAVLFWYKSLAQTRTKEGAVKNVDNILKRFAKLKGFRTLKNVKFMDKGRQVLIDNVLVGYFGIILVYVYNKGFAVYGDTKAEEWTLTEGNMSARVPNPLLLGEKDASALREAFSKNKIYNVHMESLSVSTPKNAELYVPAGCSAIKIENLRKYLDKSKYEKDMGLDIDKVVATIEELCQSTKEAYDKIEAEKIAAATEKEAKEKSDKKKKK